MNLARRIIATGAAAAAGMAAVVALASQDATPPPVAPTSTVAVADGQPGYAVEDFAYPGADKIKENVGIVLKRGDGHLTLAKCDSANGLMEVYTRKNGKICFRATGTSGHLTAEIPAVYGIKGTAEQAADVTLKAPDAKTQQVEIGKGEYKPVGESTDPEGRDHVLVEIRTSK
ncbi:hypothetical protein ACFY12_12555 [Streptomyces sp. NPDC001339]|uniref:hypothetical protein n=1 Tax=Streptomyces sp. NPDC001339 TaxID=3364563 RepID=UPI0036AE7507